MKKKIILAKERGMKNITVWQKAELIFKNDLPRTAKKSFSLFKYMETTNVDSITGEEIKMHNSKQRFMIIYVSKGHFCEFSYEASQWLKISVSRI